MPIQPRSPFLAIWITLILLSGCSPTPKPPVADLVKLEQELMALTESFNGDVGIYVKHLGTGAEIEPMRMPSSQQPVWSKFQYC